MLFPNQKNKHFPVYKPLSGSTNFILLTSLLHFPRFMEQAAKSRRGVTLTLEHEHRTRMDLALRGGRQSEADGSQSPHRDGQVAYEVPRKREAPSAPPHCP